MSRAPSPLLRAAAAMLLLAACVEPSVDVGPSSSAEPFHDQTTSEAHPDIRVTSDGAPLPGVLIHVREKGRDGAAGPVVLSMLTNARGEATGTMTIPAAAAELEIVVVAPGFRGELPNDEETQLGDFAPAARFTVRRDTLSMEIRLERKETP